MKKKHIILSLAGVLFLLVAAIINHAIAEHNIARHSIALKSQTARLTSIAKVDKVRMENINKALSVLNRYNPSMPLEMKYNVATEISNASMKFENLDVDLICATITHESAFSWDPKVISRAGAMGLMQVMPATGIFLAEIEGIQWHSAEQVLWDPVMNIRLGCRYLSSLIEVYEVDGGLAAYNGGGKRAAMWIAKNRAKGVLFTETQNYVPAVLSLYEEFRALN